MRRVEKKNKKKERFLFIKGDPINNKKINRLLVLIYLFLNERFLFYIYLTKFMLMC